VLGKSATGRRASGLAFLGATAASGDLTIDRGVVGTVVARIEEDDHPGHTRCGRRVRCGHGSGKGAQAENGGCCRRKPQKIPSHGIRWCVPARILHLDSVTLRALMRLRMTRRPLGFHRISAGSQGRVEGRRISFADGFNRSHILRGARIVSQITRIDEPSWERRR
jgi:hypothetical protein